MNVEWRKVKEGEIVPCSRANVGIHMLTGCCPAKGTVSCSPSLCTQKRRQNFHPGWYLWPYFLPGLPTHHLPKPASWAPSNPAAVAQYVMQGTLAQFLAWQPPVDVPAARKSVLSVRDDLVQHRPVTDGTPRPGEFLCWHFVRTWFTYRLLVMKSTL